MRKNAVEAARLRDQGLLIREIADRLGLACSTVWSLLNDPDGLKERARRARYGGTCEVCGGQTDGSNGAAKAPKRCLKCATKPTRGHGTLACYRRGCSCDECRAANRAHSRSLKGAEPLRHGTTSAYTNYACRCDLCRQAHAELVRSPKHQAYTRQWEKGVFGTRPPYHGKAYIYKTYGCRCDECRVAASEERRVRAARKRAAT